jgi:hypothetical protein
MSSLWCVLLFLAGVAPRWKATPISIESPTRMSMATQKACDAAVIAVQRLWET